LVGALDRTQDALEVAESAKGGYTVSTVILGTVLGVCVLVVLYARLSKKFVLFYPTARLTNAFGFTEGGDGPSFSGAMTSTRMINNAADVPPISPGGVGLDNLRQQLQRINMGNVDAAILLTNNRPQVSTVMTATQYPSRNTSRSQSKSRSTSREGTPGKEDSDQTEVKRRWRDRYGNRRRGLWSRMKDVFMGKRNSSSYDIEENPDEEAQAQQNDGQTPARTLNFSTPASGTGGQQQPNFASPQLQNQQQPDPPGAVGGAPENADNIELVDIHPQPSNLLDSDMQPPGLLNVNTSNPFSTKGESAV